MTNYVCYGDYVILDIDKHVLIAGEIFNPIANLIGPENLYSKPFKNCIFQLHPNYIHPDSSQVNKLRDQLDLLRELNKEDLTPVFEIEKDLDQEKDNIRKHEQNIQHLNEKIFNESKGVPIKFGQKVQLFHVESQKYISEDSEFDKNDKNLCLLKLTEKKSKKMYFSIKPLLSFHQESDYLEYDTAFQLTDYAHDFPIVKGGKATLNFYTNSLKPYENTISSNTKDWAPIQPRRQDMIKMGEQNEEVYTVGAKVGKPGEAVFHKYISFIDMQELTKKKCIKNGDYVRICADFHYLTIYNAKDDMSRIFFQSFDNPDYDTYSKLYTVFQILEITNSSLYPTATILQDKNKKKYILKHLVSGLFLVNKDSKLTLVNSLKEIGFCYAEFNIVNTGTLANDIIDKDSKIKIDMYDNMGKSLTLKLGENKYMKEDDSKKIQTDFYYGFYFQDDYLDEKTRPRRFAADLKPSNKDDDFYLYLEPLSSYEISKILVAEACTNQLQKFVDFLYVVLYKKDLIKDFKLRDWNEELQEMKTFFSKMLREVCDYSGDLKNEDLLTPNKDFQELLREFRSLDLIYRIISTLVQNLDLNVMIKDLKEKSSADFEKANNEEKNKEIELQNQFASGPGQGKDNKAAGDALGKQNTVEKMLKNTDTNKFRQLIDDDQDVNWNALVYVMDYITKIMVLSMKKNHFNQIYCAQFVKVPIISLLRSTKSLFRTAPRTEKGYIKDSLLALCKVGVTEDDQIALTQVNQIVDNVYNAVTMQETYQAAYINFIIYVCKIKTPSVKNEIRMAFTSKILNNTDPKVVIHMFPQIKKDEDDEIYVHFSRMRYEKHYKKIAIQNLNETFVGQTLALDSKQQKNEAADDEIYLLTDYLISVLRLISALNIQYSPTLSLWVIQYYPFNLIEECIERLSGVAHLFKLRIAMTELLSTIHQQFYTISFSTLPKKIQYLNNNDQNMLKEVESINTFIDGSFKTAIPNEELEEIKKRGIENLVDGLKEKNKTSNIVEKILNSLRDKKGTSKQGENVKLAISGIITIFSSDIDINDENLKIAHDRIIELLISAEKNKVSDGDETRVRNENLDDIHETIKLGFHAYSVIQSKMISLAAIQIIESLKKANVIFGFDVEEEEDAKEVSYIDIPKEEKHKLIPENPQKLNRKIIPAKLEGKPAEKEKKAPVGHVTNAILDIVTKWKDTVMSTEHNRHKHVNESLDHHMSEDNIIKLMLDIILMNEDSLTYDAIDSLRKISQFDNQILKEIDNIIIVNQTDEMAKIKKIIEVSFRFNEIGRKINFCNENNIKIAENDWSQILTNVIDNAWDLLFLIYDPVRHFKFIIPDAEKVFKDRYIQFKNEKWDKMFEVNPEAISTNFQIAFRSLKAYQPLLRILGLISSSRLPSQLPEKEGFEKEFLIFRLFYLILICFVYKNEENQNALNSYRPFVRLFYEATTLHISVDSFTLFSELIRNNKKLMRFTTKHLYDFAKSTVSYCFKNYHITPNPAMSFVNGGLCCTHFLLKSFSDELLNPLLELQRKWRDVVTNRFDELDMNKIKEMPKNYYIIKSLIKQTLLVIENYKDDGPKLSLIHQWLSFDEWISLIGKRTEFLLQFGLKKGFLQIVMKLYFEERGVVKLIEDSQNAKRFISILFQEAVLLKEHLAKQNKLDISPLNEILQDPNFITTNLDFLELRQNYDKAIKTPFHEKKVVVGVEELSLETLLTNYVYDAVIPTIFKVLIEDPLMGVENMDKRHEKFNNIIKTMLFFFKKYIECSSTDNSFPFTEAETYLEKLTDKPKYNPYKEEIIQITQLVNRKNVSVHQVLHKELSYAGQLNDKRIDFHQIVKSKKFKKENNMRYVANAIVEHHQTNKIIAAMINFLKKDSTKVYVEQTQFIVQVLKKIITRENTRSPDLPIYLWREINLLDLKRMRNIQLYYKSLGLSDLITEMINTKNEAHLKQVLLLALSYLYGGNEQVQEDLYNKFIQDDENTIVTTLSGWLKTLWEKMRKTETDRISFLYIKVQRNLFEYLKTGGKEGKEIEKISQKDMDENIFRGVPAELKKDIMHKSESKLFVIILSFLQALCEKQFARFQNFLRSQKPHNDQITRNYDFLDHLRHILNNYHKILSKYNIRLGQRVLDLIVELIQGEAKENVQSLIQKTFIYDMCKILTDYNSRHHTLPRGFGFDPFESDLRLFKSNIIITFKYVLEQRDEKCHESLKNHLDMGGLIRTLHDLMQDFYKKHEKITGKEKRIFSILVKLRNDDFWGSLGDAINIYIIFRYIWQDQEEFEEEIKKLIEKEFKDNVETQEFVSHTIFQLFRKVSKSIELVDDKKTNSLIRVWFPVLARCQYLQMETKQSFLTYADRSNTQSKISSLMDSSTEFETLMEQEYESKSKTFGLSIQLLYRILHHLTHYMTFTIIILNLISLTWDSASQDVIQEDKYKFANLGLNIAQAIISGLLVIFWEIAYGNRKRSIHWDHYVDDNLKNLGDLPLSTKRKIDEGNYKGIDLEELKLVLKLRGPYSQVYREIIQVNEHFKKIKWSYYLRNAYFLVNSPTNIWNIIYAGICFGSIFHPLLTVLQLFDLAIKSDTVFQIYASVYRNARQFAWTVFLLVSSVLVYSMIALYFLNDSFQDGDGNRYCTYSFECFINILNLGLRSGGGIADQIVYQYYQGDFGSFFGRAIFDLSFFIIMITILLNLIFGMIIDAFGDLRDQKTKNDDDQHNVCFICGITRAEFERHMKFETHIEEEHNIWAYVYFIIYLKEKAKHRKIEMNDVENHIYEKLEMKDYSWFPVQKSLTLEKIMDSESKKNKSQLDAIEDLLVNMKDEVDSIGRHVRGMKMTQFANLLLKKNPKDGMSSVKSI